MILLFLALAAQFTLFRRLTQPRTRPEPIADMVIGTLVLLLWFGVGLAGRAIGFL